MEKIVLAEVKTKSLLKEFIYLPARVHSNNPNWLPPIYADEWNFFNPKKNRSFSHCDTILFLAYQGGKPVGRIMGIIHKTYNEKNSEQTGRFGYFECYDNQQIANELMGAVEHWALERGMNKIIGPYGFSDKDPQGMMVDGFEHMPIIDSACNRPYLVNLVENKGYKKEFDCLVFRFDVQKGLPEAYSRIASRVESQGRYSFVFPSKKKELKELILPVLRLVNNTYGELYGFVPMEEVEMVEFAKRYLPIVDPDFVKVATLRDQLIAFIIGLPNFTPGVQKAKGKLFPFGIFHILKSMRKTKQLDLMLGAVDNQHRGKGLEVSLAIDLIESCKKRGIDTIEIHLVLESNRQMLAELERAGCQYHKRFRVFSKIIG